MTDLNRDDKNKVRRCTAFLRGPAMVVLAAIPVIVVAKPKVEGNRIIY